MRVIEPGRGTRWEKDVLCDGRGNGGSGCGAALRIEMSDVFRCSSSARDETTDYLTFECCECGTWNDLCNSDNYGSLRALRLPNRRGYRDFPYRSPSTRR